MRGTGRPGRGKRGRVATRVRELRGVTDRHGDAGPEGGGPDGGGSGGGGADGGDEGGMGRLPWLPGEQFEVSRARHMAVPVPESRRFSLSRLRWEPDRRTAGAVGVAVLLAGALTLWWVLSARPREVAVHASGGARTAVSTGQPTLSSSATPPTAAAAANRGPSPPVNLTVDVAGKVRHPGVYRLATGSRVVDALRAAGGALPGVSTISLNLAEALHDGQQVLVGVAAAPGSGGVGTAAASSGSTGGSSGGVVDLNAATLEQLQTLPGVGPVLAQHILDWRTQHGRFASVDQLNDVSGIGAVKFAELRALVTA